MKKILAVFLSFIFFYVHSENWDDHWIKALETSSEEEFNLAIKLLEEKEDETHPYVYFHRGSFYLSEGKYKEAVMDFTKALASPHIEKKDRMKVLTKRMMAYYYLDEEEKGAADRAEFQEICYDFPKIEHLEDKIIVRNAPTDECYKSNTIKMLIASKQWKNEPKIQVLNEDTWVIRK